MSIRSQSKSKKQSAKTTRLGTSKSKKQQAPKSHLQKRKVKTSDAQTKERPNLRGSQLDVSFSVKDPRAMLREHPTETQKTIETIAEGRKVERSALTNALFQKLAFRLALIGLINVNTFEKNAKNRIYERNSKTNSRSLKLVLSESE